MIIHTTFPSAHGTQAYPHYAGSTSSLQAMHRNRKATAAVIMPLPYDSACLPRGSVAYSPSFRFVPFGNWRLLLLGLRYSL